jgi:hypothetical protein
VLALLDSPLPAEMEPEVGFEPTTFRLRVEEPSSSRCHPGLFWLLRSAGSSAECVPDLPSYGRGNDQGNDQTDPSRSTEPWRPPIRIGRSWLPPGSPLPPPWSDGWSGTFRQESDAKASNSQLAQPQATRTPVGRCCPGSIRRAGFPTGPIPVDCRGRAAGAPLAWIAVRRRSARRLPSRDSGQRLRPAPT